MLRFCTFCGKELVAGDYCPSCDRMKSDMGAMRPAGITVLGILHAVAGMILSIGAVMVGVISSMMPSMNYDTMMSVAGGAISALLIVVAVLAFLIAAALFSGKRWGRTIVIVFSIINVVMQGMSIMGGNLFGFANVVLSCIVLYYMWRPHVISYFK